jgi:hypothetical protein
MKAHVDTWADGVRGEKLVLGKTISGRLLGTIEVP